MKDQIIKILSHYNYSASLFAEKIGVQRSSISHILSGRNKPSYDFIISIIETFPELNAHWVLTGNGNMLNETGKETGIDNMTGNNEEKANDNILPFPDEDRNLIETPDVDKSNQIKKITNVKDVNKVLILYTNGTFEKFEKNE